MHIRLAFLVLAVGCARVQQRIDRSQTLQLLEPAPHYVMTSLDGKPVRVDAHSMLRFHTRAGRSSGWLEARRLRISSRGISEPVDVQELGFSRAVRITGLEGRPLPALPKGSTAHVGSDGVVIVESPEMLGIDWIRAFLRREPVGDWQFKNSSGQFGESFSGARLRDALDGVEDLTTGVAWEELAATEVSNVSGSRSFGITIGTVALTAAIAPVALALRAASIATPPVGGSSSSPPETLPRETEQAPLREIAPAPPTPLFTPDARRRAIAGFVPSLEIGGDTTTARLNLMDGASFTIRFIDMFELGGGFRHLLVPADGDQVRSLTMGFFRAQGHFDLDARRRLAMVFGLDVGGTRAGDVQAQAKVNLGLRVRFARQFFAGAYPFNPTYAYYRRPTPTGRFSFPTTVEIGAAF